MDGASERVHATTIAIGSRAALIRGPSGSGKSDLALRALAITASEFLISATPRLVADDQTIVTRNGGQLIASPPQQLKNQIEVRGIGIAQLPAIDRARVVLVVDLADANREIERMPAPWPTVTVLAIALPQLWLKPFESSAALKLLLALDGKVDLPPPTLT